MDINLKEIIVKDPTLLKELQGYGYREAFRDVIANYIQRQQRGIGQLFSRVELPKSLGGTFPEYIRGLSLQDINRITSVALAAEGGILSKKVDPIVAAAVRLKGGKIYKGILHNDAMAKVPMSKLDDVEDWEGFITKSGKYMTRDEAIDAITDAGEWYLEGRSAENLIGKPTKKFTREIKPESKDDLLFVWKANRQGGQTIGNREVIREPTLEDFKFEIYPRIDPKFYTGRTIEEKYYDFKRKNPDTRISYVDTGEGFKVSKIDDFMNFAYNRMEKEELGWAKQVDSFNDVDAIEFRQLFDQ